MSSPYPHFHGATLSSLTSISLAPLPLLAFSLRLPSRLAGALAIPPPTLVPSSISLDTSLPPKAPTPTIILHYLSSSQTPLAEAFAKALPAPPASASAKGVATPFTLFPHQPSQEGIPILQGCVGAVSCRILGSIPLSEKGLLGVGFGIGSLVEGDTAEAGEATSELYIAEVVRMENTNGGGETDGDFGLPLVYHDQRYCGISKGMGRTGKKVVEEVDGGVAAR